MESIKDELNVLNDFTNTNLNTNTHTNNPNADISVLLLSIHSKLENIEKRLDLIENSTSNMDSHINFVERVYDIVKHPLRNVLSYYYNDDKKLLSITE
jgi:hypothetical protein